MPQHVILQAEGQTCPLACCLPHAGGWECGQGQATRRGPVAEGSRVEGLTVAEGSLVGLPVAERAGPLTALQAAGTQPGAKRRAQIRTAACRGTPMPRCQGGCHLAGASLKSSTNTSLWGFANAASRARPVRLSRSRDATKRNDCQTEELVVRFSRRKSPQQNRIPAWGCSWNGLR